MNGKLFSFLAATFIILSLPYAFANGDVNDGHDSGGEIPSGEGSSVSGSSNDVSSGGNGGQGVKTKTESHVDGKGSEIKTKTKVDARELIKEGNRELINRKVFVKLREETKTKLEKLSPEKLGRISSLKAENIEKLKDVSQDRLRVISSQEPERLKKLAELKKEDLEKAARLDRRRLKELASLNNSGEIEAKLKKLRIVEADEGFRLRPLSVEQAKRSERAFEQLKENEAKLREKYDERMEKLRRAKETAKECKDKPEEENCANATAEAIEHSKEAALNAAERIANHLENVRERIEGSQDLPEEEVADRAAEIDALMEEVSRIKAEVEAATTRDELNAAVEKLRKIIKTVKSASEDNAQRIIRAMTNGIIQRSEVIEKKADCSLSSLEEQGIGTSAVDAKLEEYSSLITTARQKVQEAKEAFNPDDKAAVEKSKALIKEAREAVKDAQEKLNEIRKDIRDLGGEICAEKQEIAIEEDGDELDDANEADDLDESDDGGELEDGDKNETTGNN